MTDQTVTRTAPRIKTLNADFVAVAAFSMIGFLVMLNVVLRVPDLGALIAQYNQF
jgi:hypothetical protein